jgi:hypothetical protein
LTGGGGGAGVATSDAGAGVGGSVTTASDCSTGLEPVVVAVDEKESGCTAATVAGALALVAM